MGAPTLIPLGRFIQHHTSSLRESNYCSFWLWPYVICWNLELKYPSSGPFESLEFNTSDSVDIFPNLRPVGQLSWKYLTEARKASRVAKKTKTKQKTSQTWHSKCNLAAWWWSVASNGKNTKIIIWLCFGPKHYPVQVKSYAELQCG